MRIAYLLLITALTVWQPVYAGEPLAVITSADNPISNLSLDALKLIYLRKKPMDDEGNRWIPINLPLDNPLRSGFSLFLFALLPEEHDDYWNVQYFNGITPPKVMASEEAVLRFVAMTHGAIGYVRKQKADSRVKVLMTITLPSTK